jgi:hypothetical protein
LNDKVAPWYDLLHYRYGYFAANFLHGEGNGGLKLSSIWWHDLWSLGGEGDGGWFYNNISNILGDGKVFGFWKEKWIGMAPLYVTFPALFLTNQRSKMVRFLTWV